MTNFIPSVIVGVIAGLLSSILFGWILYKYMSPKIRFTEKIYKSIDLPEPSGFAYRIGIKNVRKRDAVNLKIRSTLIIPNFPRDGVDAINYVQSSTENIMEIPPNISRNVRLLFNCDAIIKGIHKRKHSLKLLECAKEKKVIPEYFYERFPDAYILINAYVSDGYTGFSRLYRSKKYKINDLSEDGYGVFL